MTLAKRVGSLTKSETQEINDRAQELKREGKDLIDLGAGDPRFREPRGAINAAKKAMEDGYTGYTEVGGNPGLRGAIKKRYEKVFNVDTGGLAVMATVGAKSALFEITQLLYEEGDEVILPRPYWVSYSAQVELAGAEAVFATGDRSDHHIPTARDLESKISSSTKGILINSPSNPAGGVYDDTQVKEIVDLAREHDLFLVSDECYDGFIYEKDRFSTLASSDYHKVFVVGSASKNFAMTGWRLGYVMGRPKYISDLEKIQSHFTSSPPAISQKAAEAAFRDGLTLPRDLRKEFKQKRDYLAGELSKLPGIDCPPPPGSFYLFPGVSDLLTAMGYEKHEDDELARILLERAGVVAVPGRAFGRPGYLRMAYLPDQNRLEEAVRRIRKIVNNSF